MLIKMDTDLLGKNAVVGSVLEFSVDGGKLIYNGAQVGDCASTMHRPSYKGTITEVNPISTIVSVARFANLHQHSDNSLKDGIVMVKDIVKKTVPQSALTDHGTMSGFLEFYKGMNKAGKFPIIGFEAYVENDEGELTGDHLILLAKNNRGYKNIKYLCSIAGETRKRGKPHVLLKELFSHHEGIIVCTACLSNTIAKKISAGKEDEALKLANKFRDVFGDDFYLEIQRHGIDKERRIEAVYRRWSYEYGFKVVATNDAHYLNAEDKKAHDIVWCLRRGLTIYKEKLSQNSKDGNFDAEDDMARGRVLTNNHVGFDGTGYHIHTSEEMEKLFYDYPEALENTLELADKCHVEIRLGDVNLPKFEIPKPFKDPTEYFTYLCEQGYEKRFGGKPQHDDPVYLERYDYELDMIKHMGFESYFLIVWDYINWAREHNIFVGPGRGSAAGSLIAYCMGITDLDPIKLNLLFERFLNPERISWPD